MTIYIESLSSQVTPEDLKQVSASGSAKSVAIPSDRKTGKVRGFAFVERVEAPQKKTAISVLDGAKWMGRQMQINQARPKENPRKEGDRGRLPDWQILAPAFPSLGRDWQHQQASGAGENPKAPFFSRISKR
ncbi:hypothetical protein [Trichocoleus sp. Lan]|uniref:RNA recognition motif domain-containing protein n=1 Tax=Trichocoleus sp. Lan TaxID=2933927 RepID=UPI00329A4E8B